MGRLYQAMSEIEEHLSELVHEMRSLKEYVSYLEDENIKLKRQICAVSEADIVRVQKNAAKIQQEARDNLARLYEEGFHVCHIYFGEPLTESCLFCSAFLRTD